jgi:hypothetical protein
MKKNLLSFVAGVLFSVGLLFYLRLFVPAGQVPDQNINNNASKVGGLVRYLEDLRAGNNNPVIEGFEGELDSRIEDLGYGLNSTHEFTKQNVLDTLKQVKEYRIKFPRKTINPEVDKNVEKVFSKIN